RAECPRDEIRVSKLVAFLAAGRLEPDRERLETLDALLGQQRDDEARVETARQQHPDRHVGHHAAPNRPRDDLDELFLERGELDLRLAVPLERGAPIALFPTPAVRLDRHPRRRRKLVYAL